MFSIWTFFNLMCIEYHRHLCNVTKKNVGPYMFDHIWCDSVLVCVLLAIWINKMINIDHHLWNSQSNNAFVMGAFILNLFAVVVETTVGVFPIDIQLKSVYSLQPKCQILHAYNKIFGQCHWVIEIVFSPTTPPPPPLISLKSQIWYWFEISLWGPVRSP